MALITCPNCRTPVSDLPPACLYCGSPLHQAAVAPPDGAVTSVWVMWGAFAGSLALTFVFREGANLPNFLLWGIQFLIALGLLCFNPYRVNKRHAGAVLLLNVLVTVAVGVSVMPEVMEWEETIFNPAPAALASAETGAAPSGATGTAGTPVGSGDNPFKTADVHALRGVEGPHFAREGGLVYYTGVLRNASDQKIESVMIQANLYGPDKETVTGNSCDIGYDIRPGQKWRYKIPILEPDTVSYAQISDIRAY